MSSSAQEKIPTFGEKQIIQQAEKVFAGTRAWKTWGVDPIALAETP